MAKIDKIKETLGYLKLVFSIFIAIDISLVTWLYKNFDHLSALNITFIFVLVLFISFAVVYINRKILNKIDDLEEL